VSLAFFCCCFFKDRILLCNPAGLDLSLSFPSGGITAVRTTPGSSTSHLTFRVSQLKRPQGCQRPACSLPPALGQTTPPWPAGVPSDRLSTAAHALAFTLLIPKSHCARGRAKERHSGTLFPLGLLGASPTLPPGSTLAEPRRPYPGLCWRWRG
jgi:hypothetical protein